MNCGLLDLQLHQLYVPRDNAMGLIMAKTSNIVARTRKNYVFIINVLAIKPINIVPMQLSGIRDSRSSITAAMTGPNKALFMGGIVKANVIF